MQTSIHNHVPPAIPTKKSVYPRQVAFAAAFLLPLGKFLEAPSLLSRYAKGDLLLPALLWFLLEFLVLTVLLYAATKDETPLIDRLSSALGGWTIPLYALFALYYFFAALLPILDLEKFIYAAFFDTAPTVFYFVSFFLFCAFFISKGIQAVGRIADLCLFLFPLPFLALIVMSFSVTDFSHLFPFFGEPFSNVLRGARVTTPHFSDVALLLPLIANCRYTPPAKGKKSDNAKGGKIILLGYLLGAACTLVFLAVFYSVFSSIAQREHYAFIKIAQYFPALEITGRIDLLFVYVLSVVLLFYTCLPLHYATGCVAKIFPLRRIWIAVAVTLAYFFFAFFANRFYNALYSLISYRLAPVFLLVCDMLPTLFLFLPKHGRKKTDRIRQAPNHL